MQCTCAAVSKAHLAAPLSVLLELEGRSTAPTLACTVTQAYPLTRNSVSAALPLPLPLPVCSCVQLLEGKVLPGVAALDEKK